MSVILPQVSLSLLKFQEEELLKCASMETMCFYLKSKLPEAVVNNEDHILKQAMEWELGSRLKLFETEYKVMASLNERFHIDETGDMDIEILRKNNLAMIEELAICHGSIATLQEQVGELQQQLSLQQEAIKRYSTEPIAVHRHKTCQGCRRQQSCCCPTAVMYASICTNTV